MSTWFASYRLISRHLPEIIQRTNAPSTVLFNAHNLVQTHDVWRATRFEGTSRSRCPIRGQTIELAVEQRSELVAYASCRIFAKSASLNLPLGCRCNLDCRLGTKLKCLSTRQVNSLSKCPLGDVRHTTFIFLCGCFEVRHRKLFEQDASEIRAEHKAYHNMGTNLIRGFAWEDFLEDFMNPLLIFLRRCRMPSVQAVKFNTADVSTTTFEEGMIGFPNFL